MTKPIRATANKPEGEGSYTATRKYDQKLAEFQRKADVSKLAKEASRALSGPERAELLRAERRGKAGPARKPTATTAAARARRPSATAARASRPSRRARA